MPVRERTVPRETADVETASDEYAKRFAGAVGSWFLKIQEEATLRMLAPHRRATILDVGGGHGQLTEPLIQNQHRLTVFGSHGSCVKRISRFVRTGLCDFETGDFLNLPYADDQFDVVVSFRLLPHVVRWRRFLSELARVARHAVILDYPEVQSVNAIAPLLFRWKQQLEGDTRPYTCFREPDLLDHFHTQGFVYAARFRQFLLPMVLHRRLASPRVSAVAESICRSVGLTAALGSPVILKVKQENASG